MLTGNLQIKNGKYYAVLNLKVNGMRKPKWIPLGLPERGNKREAEALLNHLIVEYESRGEGKFYPKLSEKGELVTEAPEPNEADALFADYVQAWLKMIRSTVSTATHHSYRNMVNARIDPYFRTLGVTLGELTPTHLQDFYQKILDDGCK
ncbi:MAG: site-specific integrase, partial [Oscillospiraceae bacterium]|nr:site-specific integrase [Oscillospiraceae bacterium]